MHFILWASLDIQSPLVHNFGNVSTLGELQVTVFKQITEFIQVTIVIRHHFQNKMHIKYNMICWSFSNSNNQNVTSL